jgi:hypothetical protein
MCRGWRWCGRTRRSRPPSRRGGDVIAMVLKAATREVESHPLASGDHGDGVGGGVLGGGSGGGAGVIGVCRRGAPSGGPT